MTNESPIVQSGLPSEAPAIAFDKNCDLFQISAQMLSELDNDDEACVVDDPDWSQFPEIGDALRRSGAPEIGLAVAELGSRQKWAVGLGTGPKGRDKAARLALSIALAMDEPQAMMYLGQNYPALVPFLLPKKNSGAAPVPAPVSAPVMSPPAVKAGPGGCAKGAKGGKAEGGCKGDGGGDFGKGFGGCGNKAAPAAKGGCDFGDFSKGFGGYGNKADPKGFGKAINKGKSVGPVDVWGKGGCEAGKSCGKMPIGPVGGKGGKVAGPMGGKGAPLVPKAYQISLPPGANLVAQGLAATATAVLHEGNQQLDSFAEADAILPELVADPEEGIEIHDDETGTSFPEIHTALKVAGVGVNNICVAAVADMGVWGVGMSYDARFRTAAAKMALCLALASATNKGGRLAAAYPQFAAIGMPLGITAGPEAPPAPAPLAGSLGAAVAEARSKGAGKGMEGPQCINITIPSTSTLAQQGLIPSAPAIVHAGKAEKASFAHARAILNELVADQNSIEI